QQPDTSHHHARGSQAQVLRTGHSPDQQVPADAGEIGCQEAYSRSIASHAKPEKEYSYCCVCGQVTGISVKPRRSKQPPPLALTQGNRIHDAGLPEIHASTEPEEKKNECEPGEAPPVEQKTG